MALSPNQYHAIMDGYDQIRRQNQMEQERRKEEIYTAIPEVRKIDEKIVHISVEKGRQMLLHPAGNEISSLKEEIYALSMEKINLLAIHQYPTDYLDPI